MLAAAVPGLLPFLGNGTALGAGGTPLHNSGYDFNDDILDVGVRYHVDLVRVALPVVGS